MDEDLKQNLTATDTWVRGLFMIFFLFVYGVAKAVFYLIVFFQFFHTLFTGKPNSPLLDFSENLCAYLYEILLFISFNSHDMPFPFASWPDEGGEYRDDEGEQESVSEAAADEPEEATDEPAAEEQSEGEDAAPEDDGQAESKDQ